VKIDVHTHILPPDWPDLKERFGYGGFIRLEHLDACSANMMSDSGQFFRRVESNCWDPVRRVGECDAAGVDVQVLSTVPVMFSYWAKPEHAHDLARILNDHLADVVRGNPRRFVGLGTLPLQNTELSVRELERCVKELGLAGVQIGSHVGDTNLGDASLFPVFEAAQDLGAAVFVHPWDMMGKDTMPKHWLPWLVGMPAETSRAMCSMMFGGVIERLPRLRAMFAHGGGSFPSTLGRIEHGFNVRPDLVAVDNPHSPRKYLDRVYLDSLVHDADALRHIVEMFGADRIALGSDYPFPLGEARPGELIESMPDLDAETRERLLAGTALEFLGVDAGRFAETTS